MTNIHSRKCRPTLYATYQLHFVRRQQSARERKLENASVNTTAKTKNTDKTRKHSESSNLRRGFSCFCSWLSVGITIVNKESFEKSLYLDCDADAGSLPWIQDRDPHRHQNVTNCFLGHPPSAPPKISSKSAHNFLSNLVDRQTDRQTDRGKSINKIPVPGSKVSSLHVDTPNVTTAPVYQFLVVIYMACV